MESEQFQSPVFILVSLIYNLVGVEGLFGELNKMAEFKIAK